MSTTKLEPGIYAGTVDGQKRVGMVYTYIRASRFRFDPGNDKGTDSRHVEDVPDLRKVAVLDPRDLDVEMFLQAHRDGGYCGYGSTPVATKIREQLAPPRMEEPGWGEKVVAHTASSTERREYVRFGDSVTYAWFGKGTDIAVRWDELVDPEPVS